ncbi:DUF6777 domain-containing protein [Streptomyces lutosisoli]|uniref:DUF6777 domain-containing protein n=1 Tax=Streptomyces lutosisoli TaxID=2665721 RepID=A0ABW2VW77_9ACTN
MSVEPPTSGHPTGPPSGPLSGPSQPNPSEPTPTQHIDRPPSEPPSDASGGGDSGAGSGSGGTGGPSGPGGGGPSGPGEPGNGPGSPWWKSAPRVALITGVVAAAVILGLVFTTNNNGGGSKNTGSEVFLQSASKAGPDPFTESTANNSSAAPETATASAASESAHVTRGVDGSAPGLYAGTRHVSSCNVEKQISSLQADPAKNKAFAAVHGIQPSAVPAYLRSLTPVQLRMDTRVTNHGYRNGAPTSYQAVLQAGTAVLVDSHGVPRVRCACGNPLLGPVAQRTTPKPTGDSWPSYRTQNVVVVAPSTTIINVFVIFDRDHDEWIARHRGDTGHRDRQTKPPAHPPTPSVSISSPTPSSPSPCVSEPKGSHGTCSPSPASSSPSSSSSSPSSSSSSPSSSSSSPSSPSSPSSQSPESSSASESTSTSTEPPTTASESESASTSGSASADLTTQSSSESSSAGTSTKTESSPFSAPESSEVVSPGS